MKTIQKNAMQQGGECRVVQEYSCDSRPVSVGSRSTESNLLLSELVQARLARAKR
jgi:hypothetical protein